MITGAQAYTSPDARTRVRDLSPDVIVYLELGFWERGVCVGGSRPKTLLKPCYWVAADGSVHLAWLSPGQVDALARFGLTRWHGGGW